MNDKNQRKDDDVSTDSGSDASSEAPEAPSGSSTNDEPSWVGRLTRSTAAAVVSGLLVAVLDETYAAAGESSWSVSSFFLSDAGLVLPLSLAMGLLGGLLGLLIAPRQAPSWKRMRQWMRPTDEPTRLRRAVGTPLMLLMVWLWLVVSANLARPLLSFVRPATLAAGAIALMGLLVAMVLGTLFVATWAGLLVLVRSKRSEIRARITTPSMLSLAIAIIIVTAWLGLAHGTTGGEGGYLGFMGIFKRLELNLKPVGLLSIPLLVGTVSASWLRRIPTKAAAALALAPMLMALYPATQLRNHPRVAMGIERSAPLGRMGLHLAQKLTDRDKDGSSAYFGGGDCDDSNPNINPLAVDIPDNGVDEDCSGKDRHRPKRVPQATTPSSNNAPRVPKNLNVMFISIDAMRWDTSYMGYHRKTTPNLDKLAAKSTIFEHAYSLASYTGKSIGPMVCGKYPSETHMGWKHYNSYPKSDIMVQERLQSAGIHTLAVMCHWYFKPITGIGRGFDVFDITAQPPGGIDATSDTTSSADRLTDAAINELSKPENTAKRFYAWIHYFDPHAEYMHHKGVETFGNGQRDRYDHEVLWTDQQIGRLLSFIQKQPWGKKTAIIVSADHGEAFGEHKLFRHGFEVWDELVRVPLLVYVPGAPPKRVKERRSAIDIVPTILDLMGVKAGTSGQPTDFVSGTSLLPDVLAPATASHQRRDVLVDMPAGPNNGARRAFYHGDYKLIVADGVRFQLFNLAQDPAERRDLSSDGKLLNQLKDTYDQFCARLREVPMKRGRRGR